MLEILLIWQLCKSIGKIAADKGRSAAGYRFLLIGLWVGGELGSAVCAALAGVEGAGLYGIAILGAAAGAVAAFVIAKSVSPLTNTRHTGGFPVMQGAPSDPNFRSREL